MSEFSATKNLLYGVLALKEQVITPTSFVQAAEAWCHDKQSRSLDEVMLQLDMLTLEEHDQLALVEENCLTSNGQDAERSLAKTVAGFYTGASAPTMDISPGIEAPWFDSEKWTPEDRFCCDQQPFARGGQGEVFRALDRQFDRNVVVKKLLRGLAERTKHQAQFTWETAATARLQHPGIPPVFARGRDAEGRPFYAMKLVEGQNLWKAIRDLHRVGFPYGTAGVASLPDLLRRFLHVCETVEYAHSQNILHLDLKPGNVMLGKHGETVVLDWGLAKISQEQDLSSEIEVSASDGDELTVDKVDLAKAVGTPAFMAPEQWDGRLTKAVDIYGLGAMLFCLLTGDAPQRGTAEDIREKSARGDFARPRQINPKIPPGLEAICMKAMQLRPENRYPSAQDLATDVTHWLDGERVTAWQREPWSEQLSRWSRRHLATVAATAAALFVILSCLTVTVVLLARANGRARAAEGQARQAMQSAVQSAETERQAKQLARETVDNYYQKVTENVLIKQPGLEPLRGVLLDDALHYYQAMARKLGPEVADPRQVAAAHFRVGRITELVHRPGEDRSGAEAALAAYEDALRIQQSVADEVSSKTPGKEDRGLLLELSKTLNAIGRVRHDLGELALAQEAYASARQIRQRLHEADAENPEYLRVYANSLMNLGLIEQAYQRYESAAELMDKGQQLRRQEQGQTPSAELFRDQGKGHRNRAVLHIKRQQTEAAQQELLSALNIFEQLADKHPHDPEIQWLLGDCLVLQGNCRLAEQPEEARSAYQRALPFAQRLVHRNPYHVQHVVALARLHLNLANSMRTTSPPEFESALRHAEQADRLFRSLPAEYRQQEAILRDMALCLMLKADLSSLSSPNAVVELLQEAKGHWETLIDEYGSQPEYEAMRKAVSAALEKLQATAPKDD